MSHEPWLHVMVAEPVYPLRVLDRLAEYPLDWVDMLRRQLLQDTVVPEQERFLRQVSVEPPLVPLHVHAQRPSPAMLTELELPAEHKLLVGALVELPDSAEPHTPFTRVTQLPPLCEKLPWLHEKVRVPVVGWTESTALRLLPWFVVATEAEQVEPPRVHERVPLAQLRLLLQEAVLPPLMPEQLHV